MREEGVEAFCREVEGALVARPDEPLDESLQFWILAHQFFEGLVRKLEGDQLEGRDSHRRLREACVVED